MSIIPNRPIFYRHGGGGASGGGNRVSGGQGAQSNSSTETRMIAGFKVTVEHGVDHIFGNGTSYKDPAFTFKADVYSLENGTKFYFMQNMGSNQTLTPEQLLLAWSKINGDISVASQRTIDVVNYANPKDAEWKARYSNFSGSYMTGGDDITIYAYSKPHDDAYLVEALSHEIGHHIDTLYSGISYGTSASLAWKKAMELDNEHTRNLLIKATTTRIETMIRQNAPLGLINAERAILSDYKSNKIGLDAVSTYGRNSPAEDFAESVSFRSIGKTSFTVVNYDWQLTSRRSVTGPSFEDVFPNRAKLLDAIVGSLPSKVSSSNGSNPISPTNMSINGGSGNGDL